MITRSKDCAEVPFLEPRALFSVVLRRIIQWLVFQRILGEDLKDWFFEPGMWERISGQAQRLVFWIGSVGENLRSSARCSNPIGRGVQPDQWQALDLSLT